MFLLKKTQAERTTKDNDALNRKLNDLEREQIESRIGYQEKYYKSVQTAYQKSLKEAEDYKTKAISIEKEIANEKMSLEDKLFEIRLKDKNKTEEEKQSAYKSRADEMVKKSQLLISGGDVEGGKKALEQAEQLATKLTKVSDVEILLTKISNDRVSILEKEKQVNDAKLQISEKQVLSLGEEEKKSLAILNNYQGEVGKLSEKGLPVQLDAVLNTTQPKEEIRKLKEDFDAMSAHITVSHLNAPSGFEGAEHHNTGGWVGGTGNTDSVPAMLTPKEYVVTARDNRSTIAAPILEFIGRAPIAKVTDFIGAIKNKVVKLNAGGFVAPQLNLSRLASVPDLSGLKSNTKDRYVQPFVLQLGGKSMPPIDATENSMRAFILALQKTDATI